MADNQETQNNAQDDVTYVQNLGDGYFIISHNKPYKRKGWKVLIEVIFRAGVIALPFIFLVLFLTGIITF